MNGYIGLPGFTGGRTLSFDVVDVILKYLRLQGGSVGSAQDFERYVQAVAAHGVRPVLDSVHPLADFRVAFARVTSETRFGKVIIGLCDSTRTGSRCAIGTSSRCGERRGQRPVELPWHVSAADVTVARGSSAKF